MNGLRCKKLRAGFRAEFGIAPAKTTFVDDNRNEYLPSTWRRLKKRYKALRRSGALEWQK